MSRSETSVSLAGGGAAQKAAQIFRRMDNDNNGALDFGEMLQALKELGVLDGIQPTCAAQVLQKELREADTDHDGLIDFQEFQHYFQRMALYQQNESRKQRLSRKSVPSGADRNPNLKSCFRHCCQHGKAHIIGAGSMTNVSLESLRMSSRQFIRFCRELEIVQPIGQIEPMTVDIIFAQCKVPGDRSINFKGFLEALSLLAEDVEYSFNEIASLVSQRINFATTDADQHSLKASTRKSMTIARPSTPSIVAQTWKKSHSLAESDLRGPQTPRNAQPASVTKPGVGKDVQKMLEQARNEGAQQAAEEWREEKQDLLDHIQQLQDLVHSLGGQDDVRKATEICETREQTRKKRNPAHLAKEIEDLRSSLMHDLQQRIDVLGSHLQAQNQDTGSVADAAAVNKLRLQVVQLEDVVSHMQETQSSFNSTGSGTLGMSIETAPAADLEEAVQALEERALERQSRLEAAMLQIATKVDALEEQLGKLAGEH